MAAALETLEPELEALRARVAELETEVDAATKRYARLQEKLELRVEERTELLQSANRSLKRETVERREALERLQESEERWRSLVENVPGYVLTFTRQGTILFVNRPWRNLSPTEIVGTSIFQYLPEEQHAPVRQLLARAHRAPEPVAYEARIPWADGSDRWWSSRIGTIRSGARAVALIVVANDITAQKLAEQEARRRQDELAHVARLSTMGEVAGALAHQLNNPLAAISNFAGGCLRRLSSRFIDHADLADAMQEIVRQSERAAETIQRIRDFLKKGELQASEVDLNALVAEAVALIEPHLVRRNVRVHFLPSEPLPRLRIDSIQIEQVLANLLLNGMEAMRAAPRPRELTISTECDGDGVLVSVGDRGCGLSDDFESCIFEPFYSTKPHGMGIGLSISRSIVEAHGGKLWAAPNTDGPGATFTFR
ncbi:MAG: PAS domain S-box protein, partial [Planctomycetes bacterium]|nr:PAS domain S-box protein [Planctomycetota bacterium]